MVLICLFIFVDAVQDKWRNMSVMANGWGSREKARLALKRMNQTRKQDEKSLAVTIEAQSDEEIVEARLAITSSGSPQIGGSKRSIIRSNLAHYLLQHDSDCSLLHLLVLTDLVKSWLLHDLKFW